MTAKRWARRRFGSSRPTTARLLEKNRDRAVAVRPDARARRFWLSLSEGRPESPWREGRRRRRRLSRHGPKRRSLTLARPPALAIEPRRPHRSIRLEPLVKRSAKNTRLRRHRPHRLASLDPAHHLFLQFTRKSTQNSHHKAPLRRLVHQLSLSQFRGPLHKCTNEKPRKWAWIFLDSFVRFERFQRVMSSPGRNRDGAQGPIAESRSAPCPGSGRLRCSTERLRA